ncbi:hypothetical protein M422DRAFT_224001 [Sphaerobolus stellatus SS14]|nr:hypothetical protein M422DRAFT_224001 [Sphaerobolus stellatus SS14]
MPPSKRKREPLAQDPGPSEGSGATAAIYDGVDERILAKRAELLQSRQVQLEQLMTEHDDNICEAFHLEKFITLLSYDPKAAKDDTSQVFLQYKAEHDLLDKSAEATAEQTPARKTRRAKTELRSSVVANITNGISPLPTPPPQHVSSPLKGKGKSRNYLTSPPKSRLDKISSLAAISPLNGHSKSLQMQAPTAATKVSTPPLALSASPPPPPSIPSQPPNTNLSEVTTIGTPLLEHPAEIEHIEHEVETREGAPLPPSVSPSLRGVKRKATSPPPVDLGQEERRLLTIEQPSESVVSQPQPAALTPQSKIRRVILFIRPPSIKYTHPDQLPPPPTHKGSLFSYLKSYRSLELSVDATEESLEKEAETEAKTRVRIRALRKEGRLLMNVDDLPDGMSGSAAAGLCLNEPKREEDVYDLVVSSVSNMARGFVFEYSHKKNTAKKIAKAVLAWHGNREGAEEKQRKAEAQRLKALAKFTAKEIEKQWRKAVMTIRERHRAVIEEEEARLGQKHLDAILDQSGIILEAQHMDLTRTRSVSNSARGSENEDSDQGDESDEEATDSGTSGHDDVEDGESEIDVNSSFLLGEAGQLVRTPSSEPRTDEVADNNLEEDGQETDLATELGQTDDEDGDEESLPAPSIASSIVAEDELMAEAADEQDFEDIHDTHSLQEEHDDEQDPSKNILPDQEAEADIPDSVPSVVSVSETSERDEETWEDIQTSPVIETSLIPASDNHQSYSSQIGQPISLVVTKEVKMEKLESVQMNVDEVNEPIESVSLFEMKSVLEPRQNGTGKVNELQIPSPSETVGESADLAVITGPNGESQASKENGQEVISKESDNISAPNTDMLIQTDRGNDSNAIAVEVTAQIIDGSEEPIAEVLQSTMPGSAMEDASDTITVKVTTQTVDGAEEPTPEEVLPPTTPGSAIEDVEESVLTTMQEPQEQSDDEESEDDTLPPYLSDFAAAPVDYNPDSKIGHPFLLRGILRPYQQSGLEWLASLHIKNLNGILADEMGLGKTIQTISLLAHLACDRGIWGPHLIIVPTSVLLNWEMEFKKFLPGFKILPYHGSTKRRKELRVGWNNKHAFNVCVTSYTLASRDAHIFKRKAWYYMILDEAHMIKNFKSQRWNILLMFRSFRRLLLTGTPLQNNLTELWALLQFLMSGTNFANVKEFGDWFSNPLEKAIEQGTMMDEETQERVRKLHTVLRPYLLRRLKKDVEKELPQKYEHLVMCRLSKRQRFLYDEFMSRAQTQESLASGVYHKVANILMQLRKVCNHPDLFEVRPIVTSFATPRSAVADYEIKELLIRRRLLQNEEEDQVDLDLLGLSFIQLQGKSMMQARAMHTLDASSLLLRQSDIPGEPPAEDRRSISGFQALMEYQRKLATLRQWTHISYVNQLRCAATPIYGSETIAMIRELYAPLLPETALRRPAPDYLEKSSIIPKLVKSYVQREEELAYTIDRFAFITPPVAARGMAALSLRGHEDQIRQVHNSNPNIDDILHRSSIKLQIAFPDLSLIQYDCGKLQELASLLRKRAAGGHRVLIFTQMTKVLDILEIFLNFHGYRYLRLDGATKIEDRQYVTERFNNDDRIFAFIASSRSGGVGINLTGADTVVFYDSDFNPQMDRQCEDRAHRIGQIRDVHIYRFVSEHTVEEAMLRKANQKRTLDNVVIQQGAFDWRNLLIDDVSLGKVLEEFVDKEDAYAARIAAREEEELEVEDLADFAPEADEKGAVEEGPREASTAPTAEEDEEDDERTIADYMLSFVDYDWEWFSTWRV